MSPWLSNSAVTMDLLQEAGYRYVMDWTMDDQPIWLRTRKGRILSIPYPIEVNDTRGIVWYRYTAEEFADMIVDQFDEMLAQSARQPLVCPISLHPFVIGRPYRIRRLRRALSAHPPAPRPRLAHAPARDLRAHRVAAPRHGAGQRLSTVAVPSAWRAVAAATAIIVPLGSIYAFSVLLAPLEALLGLTRTDLAFVFALTTVGYGAGMNLVPLTFGRVPTPLLALGCAAVSAAPSPSPPPRAGGSRSLSATACYSARAAAPPISSSSRS